MSVSSLLGVLSRRKGTMLGAVDHEGNTVLHHLLMSDTSPNNLAARVRVLLANDPTPFACATRDDFELLREAGEEDEVEEVVGKVDVRAANVRGETALHVVARAMVEGEWEGLEAVSRSFALLSVARRLMTEGADAMQRCVAGTTPLGVCLAGVAVPPPRSPCRRRAPHIAAVLGHRCPASHPRVGVGVGARAAGLCGNVRGGVWRAGAGADVAGSCGRGRAGGGAVRRVDAADGGGGAE